MAPADETQLIQKAQDGDVDAFCVLVAQHQRSMYMLAYRYCGNHHDAEDLVQEVFLNAHRAIGRFQGRSSFRTWLSRILVNAFLNHLRKNDPLSEKRRSDSDPEASPPAPGFKTADASARTTENRLLVQEVLRFLDTVPERQRLMFLLKHQEGQTCEEIAKAMGTSVGTVKKTLFRVVGKLRIEFARKEEQPCIVAKASEQA